MKAEKHNFKQIQNIDNRLKNQEKRIKNLKSKLYNKLENQAVQIKRQRFHFQNYISKQKKNSIAIFTVLFGLLLEIFGALLLSAPALSTKIKKRINFDMRSTPGLDLLIGDPERKQILTNYSMIGSVILCLGFFVQFIGTAFLLNLPFLLIALTIIVVMSVIVIIVFVLLGIDPEQDRNQKITILFKNIMRLLKFMVNSILLLKKQCDICLKKTKKGEVFVLWRDESDSSEKHPYLHPPGSFFVGHERCLNEHLEFQIKNEGRQEGAKKIKKNYHLKKGAVFLESCYSQYKKRFKTRSDYSTPSLKEIEMDKAVEKIQRINKA